jgi:hypothetical protein
MERRRADSGCPAPYVRRRRKGVKIGMVKVGMVKAEMVELRMLEVGMVEVALSV